ncbi:RodZ domain-containing protein [Acetobacter sp. KSO5]|uniref:helix-turn-helix domain-containing protein n=1 Tax=Acetobacter sp. KSO5 TaxID=3373674 RepID=UPI00376EF581
MAESGSVPEQELPAFTSPLPDVESLGVGAALRTRREQLGWSLPDVAAWLRIRESYLEALESGRAGVFPAEAYALGFLRTYGAALGFDASALVVRYKREGKGGGRKPDLTFPAPPPDRRIPPGVSVSLGLAVILASYIGWYHFIGHAPPLPEHVPPVATIIPGAQTNNAPSPQVASILPGPGAVPSRRPEDQASSGVNGASAPQAQAGSPPSLDQNGNPDFSKPSFPATQGEATPDAGAVAGVTGETATGNSGAAGGTQPVSDQPGTIAPAALPDNQVVLKAIAPSWVQVKDASGKVAYDHIMQVDDQWTVPAEGGPYSLTVGNAGGIVLSSGTVTTQPLGRNGSVRRKLVLTPEAVKDGSLAAAQAASSAGVSGPGPSVSPAAQTGNGVPAVPESRRPAGVSGEGPASTVGADGQPLSPPPVADAPLPESPKSRPRHRPVEKPEPSADDLNARQLQGISGH